MRLYDTFLAARGGMMDRAMMGAVSKFADLLENAQCFTLSDDISQVCSQVCLSKPSSILSALNLSRAPYPLTWIEWTPSDRIVQVINGKPIPRRVGCLLVTDEDGAKGTFILAWVHNKDEITLNPLGLAFNWDLSDNEPVIAQYARAKGIISETTTAERRAALTKLSLPNRWEKHRDNLVEREAVIDLELRASIVPVDFCLPFLEMARMMPGTDQFESYCGDLEGELPFVELFLLLLNSRNTIVEQTKEDLSRLNKARAKNRRPPLKEFITTRVKLGNRVQRARMAGGSAHEVRTHLCRGHFKLRSSGVYWWSAHMRGTGAPVARDYRVVR